MYCLSKRKSNQQFLADEKTKKEEEERRSGIANKLLPADSFSRTSKSRVVLGHTSIISEESENDEGDADEQSDEMAQENDDQPCVNVVHYRFACSLCGVHALGFLSLCYGWDGSSQVFQHHQCAQCRWKNN